MKMTISNPQRKQAKAALFAVICGLDHFQTLTASLHRPYIHTVKSAICSSWIMLLHNGPLVTNTIIKLVKLT